MSTERARTDSLRKADGSQPRRGSLLEATKESSRYSASLVKKKTKHPEAFTGYTAATSKIEKDQIELTPEQLDLAEKIAVKRDEISVLEKQLRALLTDKKTAKGNLDAGFQAMSSLISEATANHREEAFQRAIAMGQQEAVRKASVAQT